jgi:putative ABC transport system substrate-binding protein
MKRRHAMTLLAGAAIPLPARAVTARIGILNSDNPEPLGGLLRKSLRELGYREGETLQLELRLAKGEAAALPRLAAELVRLKVDLIVAYLTPASVVARQATHDIPIVMMGAGDPAATGLVASLARPGGNVTGTAASTSEAGTKILGVMHDIVPALKHVAVLTNASDPFTPAFFAQAQHAAQVLQLDLHTVAIHAASELDPALDRLKNEVQAVLVQPSLPRAKVAELAVRHRLPAIAPTRSFATFGGLAAYSPSLEEIAQRTAAIVDKILKGAKPADIPVEQPTRFELVINLKTARAIALEVPKSVLDRADEVIE